MNHKYILQYVLEATRGGPTRRRIMDVLLETPSNANKLAQVLKMDYKTIQHNIAVLEKNKIISAVNKGSYGAMYFVHDELRQFLEINRDESGKTLINKK